MDFFPSRQSSVDVNIVAEVTPISFSYPNPTQASSSLPPLQRFLVEFILDDSDEYGFPLRPQTISPVMELLPGWSSSSTRMITALIGLGVELVFHGPVLRALDTQVIGFIRGPQRPALISLHVYIKRIITSTVLYVQPLVWAAAASNAVRSLGAPMPAYDFVDDDYDFEKQAMRTLKRVTANDKERYVEDGADCAICLEELQVAEEEDEDDEKKKKSYEDMTTPMKLPCQHVFHNGCILLAFKKSFLCPLCRSNVLEHIDFSL